MPEEQFPYLPENYMIALGRIALAYNALESVLLHALITALLGDFSKDGKALAAFAHISINLRLEAFESILRIIDPIIAERYKEDIFPLIKQSQEKRNAALHQTWYSFADGIRRFSVSARGKLQYRMTDVITIEELEAIPAFIMDTHNKLFDFMNNHLVPNRTPQQGQ